MSLEKFYKNERTRVAGNFNKAKHKGFVDKHDFANWFVQELKSNNCQCFYCETSIHEIVKLIDKGLLKTRRIGYGVRGPVLEVDKNDDTYTKGNCVLACYYCNNDKSYTTSKEDYKSHFGENRNKYFKVLLSKLTNKKTIK